MKTEDHIAVTRVWQSASHSRSHRHPTSFGWWIGEVLWHCNSRRRWWKTQVLLKVAWELTFPVTGRGVADICIGMAGLCRQSFRLKMLQMRYLEPKISKISGGACPGKAGSGFAFVWPFHGHIALQTTLRTPLATPLFGICRRTWMLQWAAPTCYFAYTSLALLRKRGKNKLSESTRTASGLFDNFWRGWAQISQLVCQISLKTAADL